jgi:transcriptional regulator with PAS, ATPase and Fis domain
LEIGKTIDARGASVGTQETRARENFGYTEPHASFAQPRAQAVDGGLATLDEAAAAPVRLPAAPAHPILDSWIAADPASLRLLHELRGIAATASTVLVRGESGTGKDLLAVVLHYLGPHADAPLVRIECAGVPRELLEFELFGSENGNSSADHPRIGRLEMAGPGTIVLDEIAALPMPVQAKLLRVIDEKRFERVGGVRSITAGARIIALTAIDLENAVARRTFREDLYYRLNVIPVVVPALRERPNDIGPLTEFFLARLAEIHRKPHLGIAPEAMTALQNYSYPGNIRELKTILERAVVTAAPPEVLPQDLPRHVRNAAPTRKMSLEEMEHAYIAEVLAFTQGKKTLAAQILGISRKTLLEKRKRYRLE